MGKKVDMIGRRYGRLTIIEETDKRSKSGSIFYLCKCDCGNEKIIDGLSLRSGNTKSCGCYQKSGEAYIKHNKTTTKLYSIWAGMKQRCLNKNDRAYKNYGARGIKVCGEWLNDFMSFYNWAMVNGYKEGLWIDRINNDKNYEPSNCRWATPKEQQNNKRTNHKFTYKGITHTIGEWSRITNVNYGTLMGRIKSEMENDRVFENNNLRYTRKINQYDLEGNFIKEWISIQEAERELKIQHTNIIKCCKGERKSCGGYVWRYANA